MTNQARKVVALVNDLMFTVKIQDVAKGVGLNVAFVKSADEAVKQAGQDTVMVILDLHNTAADPLGAIQRLKDDPRTHSVTLLGYFSHVHTELREAALGRGCDIVLPRSAFSHQLPSILRQRNTETVTRSAQGTAPGE
jgi:CheY-like chemotaxis protein